MQFRPGDLVMYLPWGPGAPVETVLVIVENDYDDVGLVVIVYPLPVRGSRDFRLAPRRRIDCGRLASWVDVYDSNAMLLFRLGLYFGLYRG